MSTQDLKLCKCGTTPVVARTNQKKWRVLCPGCQRYYTPDFDGRKEAVDAWNTNIEFKKGKKPPKPEEEA